MNPLLELLRQSPGAQPAPSGDTTTSDCFFAQGSLPADCLSVEIDPLGPLQQPLSPAQAQALHALSEPARFGLREQTLLDTDVRHTGEVDADRLGLHWQSGAFAALQHDVARALGVERLDAWLHNLLIYGPGQFFKPHQDTERHPGMVATLVLVWPSPHIGGELRVRFGQQEGRLASQHLQAQELRWFAFYADCRHEVLPVEEGWRVVLSFDLVVPSHSARPAIPAPLQGAVAAALREQFGIDGEAPRQRPWVLLLDHDYTEHGLRWPLLKGDDRWRVAALCTAAEALGLRVNLALAELHESWSTQPVFRSRRGYNGRGHDEPTDEVEPEELINDELSLDFWVDAQDRVGPRRSLAIGRDDMVCLVETGKAHLVDEQYEGYMGNYGDTLDYWYRRAALVIRTPMADERDRFELDFDAALDDALQLARESARDPTRLVVLAERVQAASRALTDAVSARGRVLFDAYAEIAAALPEPEAASALMSPFDPARLEAPDAEVLARLGQQRDTDWVRGLLRRWYDPNARRWGELAFWQAGWKMSLRDMPRLWPQPLPEFIAAALQAGWPDAVLDEWFEGCLRLLTRLEQACAQVTPANRLSLQVGLLSALGELAQALVLCIEDEAAPGERHLQSLIHQILVHPQLYPLPSLRPVVEAMGAWSTRWPAQAPLRTQVVTALRHALAQAERAPDDHNLRGVAWTCRCTDCAGLIAWAESPAAQPLVMAMAEPRRRHVEEKFAESGAPLTATTLRQGSPHKLVLGKPADLQARDRVQRERWARDLAALEKFG
jgi:hypothetical protein